jgi:hypothetical protein
MSKKYDDFIAALTELCREHKVSLHPSDYDGLQIWDDEDGSEPLGFPYVENWTKPSIQEQS